MHVYIYTFLWWVNGLHAATIKRERRLDHVYITHRVSRTQIHEQRHFTYSRTILSKPNSQSWHSKTFEGETIWIHSKPPAVTSPVRRHLENDRPSDTSKTLVATSAPNPNSYKRTFPINPHSWWQRKEKSNEKPKGMCRAPLVYQLVIPSPQHREQKEKRHAN